MVSSFVHFEKQFSLILVTLEGIMIFSILVFKNDSFPIIDNFDWSENVIFLNLVQYEKAFLLILKMNLKMQTYLLISILIYLKIQRELILSIQKMIYFLF